MKRRGAFPVLWHLMSGKSDIRLRADDREERSPMRPEDFGRFGPGSVKTAFPEAYGAIVCPDNNCTRRSIKIASGDGTTDQSNPGLPRSVAYKSRFFAQWQSEFRRRE